MSRIHEALKKAEQELSSALPSQVVAPVIDPVSDPAPERAKVGAPFAGEIQREPSKPPSQGPYLRFDDIRARCVKREWRTRPNSNIFSDVPSTRQGAEQFRTLRSRLYQLRGNRPLRSILVTSALPDEGKTFVATNLAHAVARQADRTVLIIDADLRRPYLHRPLGAPATPGLTEYLRGDVDEMAVIQQGPGGNLCLIPSGTTVENPSELLMNGRLKMLINRLAAAFTWIIVDSPPCLLVSDASVLADVCDGVLLVVRAASTPASTANRACQEMQGRNVVGVVLNSAVPNDSYGAPYYGYGEK